MNHSSLTQCLLVALATIQFFPRPSLAQANAKSAPTDEAPSPEKKELRPLSTDRPDVTESPYTVDAGHFQAEIDVARYSQDEGASSMSFANSNLKLGITNFWDMQLVIESLVGLEEPSGYNWGFGDVTVRSKFNLFGNDEGNVALGVMPWVKIPTAGSRGNDYVEGGLIGLLGVGLPADFSSGFMVEGDMMKNALDDDYHFELLTTATLGHSLFGPLSAYIELFGVHSTESGAEYALSTDGGLTCLVTEHFQLDAGVAVGLTDAAEDLSVFTGASFKL
jgi:hypothetical protein